MAESDLWRFENVIAFGLRDNGRDDVPLALMSDWWGGQWAGKLRAKGYAYPHGPMPPASAWASKNWDDYEVLCRVLSGHYGGDAWGWVTEDVGIELQGRFFNAEQGTRVYFHHKALPVLALQRLAPYEATRIRLHRWNLACYRLLALMAVPAPQVNSNRFVARKSYACGWGAGARSLSDPPGHLDYWTGGKMLFRAIHGGSPFDRGSVYDLMWGDGPGLTLTEVDEMLSLMAGDKPSRRFLDELPGMLAPMEVWRFHNGVLTVLLDNGPLSTGSTDSIAAIWTGNDGRQKFLSPDDGRRGGGRKFKAEAAVSNAGRLWVRCSCPNYVPRTGMHDTFGPGWCEIRIDNPGPLSYCVRIDHQGARLTSGSDAPSPQPPAPPPSPGGYSEGEIREILGAPPIQPGAHKDRWLVARRLLLRDAVEEPGRALADSNHLTRKYV